MAELSKRDRMRMERTAVPVRKPEVRTNDFEEVSLGFTSALAVLEASRCLNCKRPVCVDGCPVGVRIADFIQLVADGEFSEAAHIVLEDNALPAVCGRVCPQERQCEAACVLAKKGRPIAIGALERFVADRELEYMATLFEEAPATGHRVAVVGSGPAGLACAGELARLGHEVTVFEALHELGGVLNYGIPAFRLPRPVVAREIDRLRRLGVRFETDVLVGASPALDELLEAEGFDAVFIGTGAGLPRFPGIPGEDLVGVYSANEFLTRINLMGAHDPNSRTPVYDLVDRTVVVIGGGNTAMDAARTAIRLGAASVTVLYRRSREEMPARAEEADHAAEEGVAFQFLVRPVAFAGEDGWLRAVTVQEMEQRDVGEERAALVPRTATEYDVCADVAIIAIGNVPNPILVAATPDLATTERGTVAVDPETGATSLPGIFAGGDIATGGATVIRALAAGRRAAHSIDDWVQSTPQPSEPTMRDGEPPADWASG